MRGLVLWMIMTLLNAAQSITYGDTSMPSNSNSFLDENVLIQFYVNGSSISFCVTLKYFGYFGLLYGSQMSRGDFTIAEISSGGVVTLTDSHMGSGYGAPVADTIQNVNLSGYETDMSTYVKVKFSRLLDTGDAEDTVLVLGQTFGYSYAFSSTSRTMVYHGTKRKIFSGVLSNSASLQTHTPLSDKLVHGVILTVAWCVIADIAIFFKFAYWHPARLLIHTLLMTSAITLTVCSIIYIMVKSPETFQSHSNNEKSHYIIGLSVFTWMLLQMIEGVIARVLIFKPETLPKVIINLRRFHRWSGYVLVLLCKANCIIGWYLTNLQAGLIVVSIEIGLIFSLYGIFRWKTWGIITSEVTKLAEVVKTKQSQHLLELMKYPYNSKEVQSYKFVVLDDKIYMLPIMGFHPGGINIIDFVNGREIDRFLYGLCFLELYPHLEPNEHPRKALELLAAPVGQLQKNPLIQLTDSSFIIGEMRPYTQDISVFYFQPINGLVIFRKLENLWHLGQYFSIYAFGKTRLYSVAISFRKENMYLHQCIIKALVPIQKRLKTAGRFMSYVNRKYADDSLMDLNSEARLRYPDGTLPLVIKRYDWKKAFTRQLYANLTQKLEITGLKGRGMCLGSVPEGQIVIIAAGSGVCRFLDLVDLVMKATVHLPDNIKIPDNQLRVAKNLLQRHSITLILSVPTVQQLLVPDELNLIAMSNSPRVRIVVYVKEPFSSDAFMTSRLYCQGILGPKTIQQYVLPLKQLQMVYLSVPPIICKGLVTRLLDGGIDSHRIFFM